MMQSMPSTTTTVSIPGVTVTAHPESAVGRWLYDETSGEIVGTVGEYRRDVGCIVVHRELGCDVLHEVDLPYGMPTITVFVPSI